MLEQFLALQYDVAQQEVHAAGTTPSSDTIRDYLAICESVRNRYLEQAVEYRQRDDLETYAEKFASYQGLVRDHVHFLQRFHAHEQALDELYRAQAVFAESQDIFARSTMVTTTDSQGQTVRKEIPLQEKYGLLVMQRRRPGKIG